MPRYYFEIKDCHRLVDPTGSNFKNDNDAIAYAKLVAIEVALDVPKMEPKRHIFVLNENRCVLFRVPVYSNPQAS